MRLVGLGVASFLASVVLASCGREEGPPPAGGGPEKPASRPGTEKPPEPATPTTPSRPGPNATPPGPGTDAPAAPSSGGEAFEGVGTVEEAGVSIHMQGTHKLVEGGKTVALLEGDKAELARWAGKRATVKGRARPTVDGNQTIVAVTSISAAR